MHGYIVDQGSFNSVCSYGYGNKRYEHSKPLQGILRHDSVLRVGRRAFFNRYGLVGTYFPKNATEFAVESYANTTFNDVLLLPKNLQKIGPRAFMGSKNIKVPTCIISYSFSQGIVCFQIKINRLFHFNYLKM